METGEACPLVHLDKATGNRTLCAFDFNVTTLFFFVVFQPVHVIGGRLVGGCVRARFTIFHLQMHRTWKAMMRRFIGKSLVTRSTGLRWSGADAEAHYSSNTTTIQLSP